MQSYREMGTYSHSGIELYTHYHKVYLGLSIIQLITIHQSKLAFKFSFQSCQYDQAIRPRVDLFILLKPMGKGKR